MGVGNNVRYEIDEQTGLFIRPQRIYVAAKPSNHIEVVRQMYKDFEAMGHSITKKWTDEDVRRPYRNPDNRTHNLMFQNECLLGAYNADVFVLMQGPELDGALKEAGAFLVSVVQQPKGRLMYIVEEDHIRQSIFDSPEYVRIVDSVDSIYESLGKINMLSDLSNR